MIIIATFNTVDLVLLMKFTGFKYNQFSQHSSLYFSYWFQFSLKLHFPWLSITWRQSAAASSWLGDSKSSRPAKFGPGNVPGSTWRHCDSHQLSLSYSEALEESGLVRLDTRHEEITQSTFRQVKCPTHPLHYMLPPPPQGFHFSNDIKTDLPLFSSKV